MNAPLARLGFDSEWAAEAAENPELTVARVTAVHRGFFDLTGAPGLAQGVLRGAWAHATALVDQPTVGDWVGVAGAGPIAPIERLFTRRSLFVRRAAGRRSVAQPIAANVDTVFVVTDLREDFNPRRIERYLIAIAQAGATPVLVLNKVDLDAPRDASTLRFDGAVHRISALTGQGVEVLAPYTAAGQTVALVGSSGVGKSTLTNRLLGGAVQATGGLRTGDEKGRHTTTSRALFLMPDGGALIDTPGMRELALLVDEAALDDVFDDIVALADGCRFRNCAHDGEPGCAIAQALAAGDLAADRWASFQKLHREIAYENARTDVAAQRARQKTFAKHVKAHIQRSKDRKRLGWKA